MIELLDVVDRDDRVIGQVTRQEVYQKNLFHRVVHIFIIDDQGRIALQLRSKDVSWCPLHWSTSVGGHVQSGETYEQAALREYQEELGTTSALKQSGKCLYESPEPLHKFLGIFTTTCNGPFYPDPQAVERFSFFTLDEIRAMIASGEKFHPELLFLLKQYFL